MSDYQPSVFQLATGAIAMVVTGGISFYLVSHIDSEAGRLLNVRMTYGPLRRSGAEELRIIRRRALVGYTIFVCFLSGRSFSSWCESLEARHSRS
jgi:hypothetical protein